MLSALRRHAYSWGIRLILGLIVVVFVFWGIGSGFFTQIHPVATVNGEKVLPNEVAQAVSQIRAQMLAEYGSAAGSEVLKQLNLGQLVLERLIEQRLIQLEARRLRLTVSDAAVAQNIAANPVFQRHGQFDRQLYEDVLRANNLQPAEYEQSVRARLTGELLRAMVMRGVYVSTAQIRDVYNRRHERLIVAYLEVPYTDFIAHIEPSDQQIEQFYRQRADSFRQPERVKIEYLNYDPQRLGQDFNPSQREIESYYKANLQQMFSHPEQRRVRHIFLNASSDPKARAVTAARASALLTQLKQGVDFAQMAREYSDDSATRLNGGELGFIERGRLMKPFEEAVFKLKAGELSGVIELPSGFDLAQVEEVRPAHTDPLSAVHDKVVKALKLQRGVEIAQRERREDFRQALNGRSLKEIAEQRNLTVIDTPFFAVGEDIPEIGRDTDFAREAIKLSKGAVGLVRDRNGNAYLVKAVDKAPAHIPPLKEIYDRVREGLIQNLAEKAARERAAALLRQVKNPANLDAVAASAKLKVQRTPEFDRASQTVPGIGRFPELTELAATVAQVPGMIDQILEHEGDAYVVALLERKPPTDKQWEQDQADFQEQLIGSRRDAAWTAFLNALKQNARIEVDPNQLAGASGAT
jgi:peptidyl-prolyl cis-trans isomerase D